MKQLLMVFAALLVAGCQTVIDKRTYIKVVNCRGCAPTACENCQPLQARQVRCTEGRIQGDFGQVFRVECPGGRVSPEMPR